MLAETILIEGESREHLIKLYKSIEGEYPPELPERRNSRPPVLLVKRAVNATEVNSCSTASGSARSAAPTQPRVPVRTASAA